MYGLHNGCKTLKWFLVKVHEKRIRGKSNFSCEGF